MTLDYTNENYKFNNESPWSMNTSEIMFLLADNGVRQDTTTRPAFKCWIPTLMGPKQTPLPRITYSGIPKNHFINSNFKYHTLSELHNSPIWGPRLLLPQMDKSRLRIMGQSN